MRGFLAINKSSLIIFSIIVLFISVYYNYASLLFSPPVGNHIWRQADSASFAWSYWQNNNGFFSPQIMNLSYGNGYAGSEFPVFQYFTAKLYSLFGFQYWFQKAIHLVFYFSGIYAMYSIAQFFTKNFSTSIVLSILFFAAPTLVFYANNFTPDVVALSCSFIALALYFKSKQNSKSVFILGATLFFTLSGLLKATYLIPLVAIILAELSNSFFCAEKHSHPKHFLKYLLAVIFVFAATMAWVVYIKNYNQINGHKYFLTSVNSLWSDSASTDEKKFIWQRTINEWKSYFFHDSVHYLFLFSLVLLPYSFRKGNRFLSFIILYLLLGVVAYYLLWYNQFYHHDYYTIPVYSLYFFSILNLIYFLLNNFRIKIMAGVISLFFITLILINARYTKEILNYRISDDTKVPWNSVLWGKDLKPYLKSIGISENDVIISIPDNSPQVSLYMLGRQGYTNFREGEYNLQKILDKKNAGVKFLIVSDETLNETIKDFSLNKAGTFKSITVYRL